MRPAAWISRTVSSTFVAATFAILLSALLSACAPGMFQLSLPDPSAAPSEKSKLLLRQKPFTVLPGWETSDVVGMMPIFLRSCDQITHRHADAPFGNDPRFGTVAEWIVLCDDARAAAGRSERALRYFFETRLVPYLVTDKGNSEGLFTGYYEAELRGSWQSDSRYSVPIYARPNDLISVDLGKFRAEWAGKSIAGRIVEDRFDPYPSRAEINRGGLSGRQLEVLWVDSHVDAFFLHIQGSGRVLMSNGGYVRLGYAGRNGQRYVAVGRELIAAGLIAQDDISMQTIRSWMEANPVAAMALMNTNPSYVFFRIMEEANPVGAQGIQLTPGRSLAVDNSFIPYGALLWLDTTDPRDPDRNIPLRRLVIAQDTGSAIKGPVRGDLFWGFGPDAALAAGEMKERGSYYVLVPRRADSLIGE